MNEDTDKSGMVEQSQNNDLKYISSYSVDEFLSSASTLKNIDRRSLFIIDIQASRPSDGILKASTFECQTWFDIPTAAIKTLTPIGFGCNWDPQKPLVSIEFQSGFQSLSSTFQMLGTMDSGGGYRPRTIPLHLTQGGIRLLSDLPEPCPTSPDIFLAEPGSFDFTGVKNPPPSAYVKISYDATNIGPLRILIKQNDKIVGRFYGDLQHPQSENTFYSSGGDIKFELSECMELTDGTHQWIPLTNFVLDQSAGDNHDVLLRTSNEITLARVQWGPNIVPPPPPAPKAYLQVGGQLHCGGILGANIVATSYAFAWTTSTPDPNGPRIAVPNLSASLYIPCRTFRTPGKSGQNISDITDSEQFHGINVPICCEFYAYASATLPDGSKVTKSALIQKS